MNDERGHESPEENLRKIAEWERSIYYPSNKNKESKTDTTSPAASQGQFWSEFKERRQYICGVYAIKNSENGKIYIGSSTDIQRRYRQHIAKIVKGEHHSAKLQHDFNSYGRSAFRFSVVEVLWGEDAAILREREQYYIDKYQAWDVGYNERRIAGGPEPSRETLIMNRYEALMRETVPDPAIPPSEKSVLEWKSAVQREEESNKRIKAIVFCVSLALMFFGYWGVFIGVCGIIVSFLLEEKSNLPRPEPITPPLDGKVRMILTKQISIERRMTIDAATVHIDYCIARINKRRSDSEKWKRVKTRRGMTKHSMRDVPGSQDDAATKSAIPQIELRAPSSIPPYTELDLEEDTVTYGPI